MSASEGSELDQQEHASAEERAAAAERRAEAAEQRAAELELRLQEVEERVEQAERRPPRAMRIPPAPRRPVPHPPALRRPLAEHGPAPAEADRAELLIGALLFGAGLLIVLLVVSGALGLNLL